MGKRFRGFFAENLKQGAMHNGGKMEFLRQCRSCPEKWESGIYCPACGSLGEYIPAKPAAKTEEKRKKLTLLREAKTLEEVETLAQKLGYRPGFAHYYWRARQIRRGNG